MLALSSCKSMVSLLTDGYCLDKRPLEQAWQGDKFYFFPKPITLAVIRQGELGSPLPSSLLWSYISWSTLEAFFSWSFLKYLALVLLFPFQMFFMLDYFYGFKYNYLKSFFFLIRKTVPKFKNMYLSDSWCWMSAKACVWDDTLYFYESRVS